MGDLVQKGDTIIPQGTVVVPARIERPSIVYNFEDVIVRGDFVLITIKKNDRELQVLKYECTEDVELNSELRPYIHFQPTVRKVTTDTIK